MNFLNDIFKYENHCSIHGLTEELNILYIINYFNNNNKNIILTTNSLYDSNKLYQHLKTYSDNVCLFPMDDFLSSVAIAISPDLKIKRLETLEKIKNNNKSIIVTNLTGYLRFLPSKEKSDKLKAKLEKNKELDRDKFVELLEEFGYKRTSLVTSTGEYAVRGFIIDVFLIEQEKPLRIEFFGDEIDSLRFFNEDTQLSINEINSITVLPIDEINTKEKNSLYDYLDNPIVFFYNYDQILAGFTKMKQEMADFSESKGLENDYKYMYDIEDINPYDYIYLNSINSNFDMNGISYKSNSIENFKGNYDRLKDFCDNCNNKTIIICLSNEKQINTITSLFNDYSLNKIEKNKINILNKKINNGFIINDYIVIGENDIDETKSIGTFKNSMRIGRKIKDFNDLKVGDYVVHAVHGIGVYGGIVPLTKKGLVRDYILINYLGNDKVYIPVEKISTIYKYSDGDGVKPTINKLNSTTWAKTKMKVRSKIKDISDELIKLYATRANSKGPIFEDVPEEVLFGSEFEFKETADQEKCINEILKDLSSSTPMDRLLCGDVGFGKTEVAFRAMFKTVMNGYQVAYLCPTTLLSRQQYKNAVKRFKDFPINIELLNRFTTQKNVTRILNGLFDGSVDIVIGTHKLFNKDIIYNKLGLLVIDEEQRFGVTHKEKIKEIKNDVNVLTLSATPIPRTLKMAMSGLRDLSIIDTAPVNRFPVQTYVLEENDILMKDAIYKELSRDGQIFILYNKVSDIDDYASRIKTLVPEARIITAHGQMDKKDLENVVTDFVDYKYDILICTTIIETGIDIPNVNTLIIIDADNFGLSQLYQIRGRVGRSDRIAYAYLMYRPSKVLTDTAIKRLNSIKDFTELGSGYKIAMRDLSIRGAGDLLGSEQAGFVSTIGLELYMQMVNEEVKRLNGEEIEQEEELANPLIEVENHISDDYVKEESIKIEIHKMINAIKDEETLDKVRSEIEDRFGHISNEMEIYMYEEWFEKLASKLNIKKVNQTDSVVEIELPEDISNKVEGDKLFLIIFNINPRFRLSYRLKKIHIALPTVGLDKHFIYYEVHLLNEIINMINKK